MGLVYVVGLLVFGGRVQRASFQVGSRTLSVRVLRWDNDDENKSGLGLALG